jgi:hypothetical protein
VRIEASSYVSKTERPIVSQLAILTWVRCPRRFSPSLGEHTGAASPSVKAPLASLGGSAGLDPRARARCRESL